MGDRLARHRELRVVSAGTDEWALRVLVDADDVIVVGVVPPEADLEGLLTATRPDVVVFGREVSATSIIAAREEHPDVGIVVVWPAAVAAIGADEHVVPGTESAELVDAVRRASRPRKVSRLAPVVAPVPVAAAASAGGPVALSPVADIRDERRRRPVAAIAVAACLVLIAVAAGVLGSGGPSLRLAAPTPHDRTTTPHRPVTPRVGGLPAPTQGSVINGTGPVSTLVAAAGSTGAPGGSISGSGTGSGPTPTPPKPRPNQPQPNHPNGQGHGVGKWHGHGKPGWGRNDHPGNAPRHRKLAHHKPDRHGKPDHPGNSDQHGKPDHPGKSDQHGKPDHPGKSDHHSGSHHHGESG